MTRHGARLAEAGLSLMACRTDVDVFDVVCEFVGGLVPDVVCIVGKATPDQHQMVAHAVCGLGEAEIARASSLIGFEVNGRVSPIDERLRDRYSTRKLAQLPGGLVEFTAVELPKPVAMGLAKAFGIADVYTIGIADERTIYGSLAFLTRRDSEPLPAHVIESFVYQCFQTLSGMATERALRQSEEKYRVLTESMKDVVWTLDVETLRFLYVSPSVFELRGYTPEEVIAEPMDAALTPEGSAYVRASLMEGLGENPSPETIRTTFNVSEIEQPCKDGSMVWTEVITRVYVNEETGRIEVHGVTRDITRRKHAEAALLDSNARLEGMVYSVAEAMGRAVEVRDPYTQGHEQRVAKLARRLALEMGLPEEEANGVEMAALVHDIGKLSVPAEILNKPGVLSPTEFGLIKRHPRTGYEILKGIEFPWPVAEGVLHHHERIDGSGYPDGLSGDEVTMMARILGVADVIEAMASDRPYRPALGIEAAMAEIIGRPTLFDPDVTAACVRLHAAGGIAW